MKWTAAQLPALDGNTVLVTGANSGIGRQTVRALAARGARVVLACRDCERGDRVARKVRADVASARVDVVEVDLASMKSIRTLAENWSAPLDVLINNAGVMAPPVEAKTEDGYELQFGTNHLGHYVLTGLLLPALLESSAPRVVTVSSIAHHGGDEGVVLANAQGDYDGRRAYANSKLANLLFALELQRQADSRRLPLVSTAAHPGVAATGLARDPRGMGANPLIRTVAPIVLTLFTQSASAGARAVLFAATEAPPSSFTGPQRFRETRGPIGPARMSALARDERLARRLWQVSEELTGFRYPWD